MKHMHAQSKDTSSLKPKAKLELRAWLTMAALALLITGIGLLLFLAGGSGSISDFFADLAEINLWLLLGVVAVIGAGVVLLIKTSDKAGRTRWDARALVTAALCISLSFVLSYIQVYRLPNGGAITPASMLPILLFAHIYGAPKGFLAAFAYALLQMTQGMTVVHWAQFILDYVLAFSVLGAAGFFKERLLPGIIAGGLLRFLCAFLSGVIFFAEYAPVGQSVILYSLGYNASYMIPEIALCCVIALLPGMRRTVADIRAKRK